VLKISKLKWVEPQAQELDVKMTEHEWSGTGSDGWIATNQQTGDVHELQS